jgi:hypothetical protein
LGGFIFFNEDKSMPDISKYVPLLVVICIGIVVQVVLIPLDCINKPYKTAVAFTEAYLRIDPSMTKYLCEDTKTVDDIDMVAQYIYDTTKQAQDRGFDKIYLRSKLYNIETHTMYLGDSEATVSISAKKRTAINPIFAMVTKLFCIGETHPFKATIEIIKEDGTWKVCGSPLSLHQDV